MLTAPKRMADLMTFSVAIASEECPSCRLNWTLFPPVKIDGQQTLHRCIECKRVYEFVAREIGDGR